MNNYTFPSEKINVKQLLPILFFVFFAFILFIFSLISVQVLIQFLLVLLFFFVFILLRHYYTSIIINSSFIMYKSIFKTYKIKWEEVKKTGEFQAVGLAVISENEVTKHNFFSEKYIYVTTKEDYKIEMLKKNSKSFIRFHYDEKARELIQQYLSKII